MAISAYDSKGRLKKHALLGTSLAVDPSRGEQRKGYKALHDEARLLGSDDQGGRTAMRSRLQTRFSDFSQDQTSNLSRIASRKGALTEELAGLRDIPLEQRLDKESAAFEGWSKAVSGEPGSTATSSFHTNAPAIPQQYQEEAETARLKTIADFRAGNQPYGTGTEINTIKGQFAPEWYQRTYGTSKQKRADYDKNLSLEIDRINKEFIPLQKEESDRKQRIQSRMELYNMFLGA